jgi:hypothetical protein
MVAAKVLPAQLYSAVVTICGLLTENATGPPSRRLKLVNSHGPHLREELNEQAIWVCNRDSNLDWFNLYIWKEPIPKDSPVFGLSELEAGK